MPIDQRVIEPGRMVSVPTQVEAEQWTRSNRERVLRWLAEAGAVYATSADDEMDLTVLTRTHHVELRVATPQGMKPVLPGDWVVRGVLGEWYPIADTVRRARYRDAPAAVAGEELGELEEATALREVAERQWRAAVRRASASGASPAAVARRAGVPTNVVRQILAEP